MLGDTMSLLNISEDSVNARRSALQGNLSVISVSAQITLRAPAQLVWDFVQSKDSYLLTSDAVVRAFTVPGTPEGVVGEQICLIHKHPDLGLLGLLHEVVELGPGMRVVVHALSAVDNERATTEVFALNAAVSVMKMTSVLEVAGAVQQGTEALAKEHIHAYGQRVKEIVEAIASDAEQPMAAN